MATKNGNVLNTSKGKKLTDLDIRIAEENEHFEYERRRILEKRRLERKKVENAPSTLSLLLEESRAQSSAALERSAALDKSIVQRSAELEKSRGEEETLLKMAQLMLVKMDSAAQF